MSGTTADWNVAGNWTSSNFPDNINENAILSTNARPTVTSSITIGTLTGNGDNTLTINTGVTLTLGANGNAKNLTMNGNNPKIVVNAGATLTIWGDATFLNKVEWTINGTVIIKGNLTMTGGTSMNVGGTGVLKVEKDLTTGSNSDINVATGGLAQVFKNLSVGSGNLNGSGTFQFGGTCTYGGVATNTGYCHPSRHNSTLPVELIFFNVGRNIDAQVDLTWATATELNFDYFNVQRSVDGKTFETIARIPGHGTTKSRHDYLYVDRSPLIGTTYYRLQSVDFDGYTETFKIESAKINGTKSVVLYPVPLTTRELFFHANFSPKSEIVITIAGITGIELAKAFISPNETDLTIPTSLEPGVYMVKITSPEYNRVTRLVVK